MLQQPWWSPELYAVTPKLTAEDSISNASVGVRPTLEVDVRTVSIAWTTPLDVLMSGLTTVASLTEIPLVEKPIFRLPDPMWGNCIRRIAGFDVPIVRRQLPLQKVKWCCSFRLTHARVGFVFAKVKVISDQFSSTKKRLLLQGNGRRECFQEPRFRIQNPVVQRGRLNQQRLLKTSSRERSFKENAREHFPRVHFDF